MKLAFINQHIPCTIFTVVGEYFCEHTFVDFRRQWLCDLLPFSMEEGCRNRNNLFAAIAKEAAMFILDLKFWTFLHIQQLGCISLVL